MTKNQRRVVTSLYIKRHVVFEVKKIFILFLSNEKGISKKYSFSLLLTLFLFLFDKFISFMTKIETTSRFYETDMSLSNGKSNIFIFSLPKRLVVYKCERTNVA